MIPLFCSLCTRVCFVPITQKVEPFLVSHFFFLLILFLRKPWLTFLFRNALDVTFLMIHLLAVLPFCHFSWVSGIQLYWFESSLLLLPFFIVPCSGSSRYRSFCIMSGYSRSFSLLLARFLISKKDVSVLCF